LDLGLEKYPDNARFHSFYAYYFASKHDYTKALKAMDIALEIEPENASFLCLAAKLNIWINRPEEAKYQIDLARQIDPNLIDVVYMDAIYAIQMQDNHKALRFVEDGLAIEPNNADFISLRTKLLTESRSIKAAKESAFQGLSIDPTDARSKENLLEVLKNENKLLRFFVGNSFNRYQMEWTIGQIVLCVIFLKGVILWGGFALLYLIVTWYGGVLYKSVLRKHHKYKYLLSESDLMQSNFFLISNGLILTSFLLYKMSILSADPYNSVLFTLILTLFLGISFFEINSSRGKQTFYVYLAFSTFCLVQSSGDMIGYTIVCTLLLLLYAFLFTLNIAFR